MEPKKKSFLKLVFIGESGVGKTSIIQRFAHGNYAEQFKPTIGADFCNKEIFVDNSSVVVQIWDTAGQERY